MGLFFIVLAAVGAVGASYGAWCVRVDSISGGRKRRGRKYGVKLIVTGGVLTFAALAALARFHYNDAASMGLMAAAVIVALVGLVVMRRM